ncbi:MAG: response regulator [Segetibacter sp.]|nr:response regulator [Segetibacter sp.]
MNESANGKAGSVSTIHNLKETCKRVTQFCCVGMAVASITVVTNFIYGNTLSALLVTGLIAALAIMVWINIKGNPRIVKFGVVILLNAFLVIIAFAEGLNTASTLYFLPLLYAIPFFIDNNKAYKRQVSILFSITLICFASCIIFCGKTSSWQPISDDVFHKMFIVNSFCSFLLCAIFSYLSIFLEKKYGNALLKQMNKTEEAMDARTKFLSSMGHELRTPLNGIIGATNLLRSAEALPEQKDYLDILKYCSDHMLGLVNDILDFNKIEAGQLDLHPVECNIKKLLKQSTLPFYNSFEEKKIELLVTVDERLNEIVLIDDLRLVQIINNLLSNALKFTESGFVKLEVTQKQKKNNVAVIQFAVQDSGIGIKETDQEKIFGIFWQVYNETTRKYSGTGLGLTICQRLLNMMNSSLSVESEEGKGSKFYFTITVPVVAAEKEKMAMPVQKNSDLEGIRILLAEDNIINMMIAKKFLEDKKATLKTVENGQEALDYLQKEPVDLILLDLEMPVMDGYTAVVEMRKKYPKIPVIAFTAALMDQEMLQRLLDLGFLDCILKPFQPMDLFSTVRKHAKPLVAEYL